MVFLKSRRGMNFSETSMEQYRARLQQTSLPVGGTRPARECAVGRARRATDRRSVPARHATNWAIKDGHVSPDLSFEGLIRDDNWLMDHFKDPRSRIPDSIMPVFGFSDGDYRSITEYLLSRKTAPTFKSARGNLQRPVCPLPRRKRRRQGRDLSVSRSGAARFDQGGVHEQQTGRALPDIAQARRTGNFDAAVGACFERGATQGRARHMSSRTFVKEPRQRTERAQGAGDEPGGLQRRNRSQRGEQIFLHRCTGCHGRKADGKGPNSLDISPRPRNLRNSAFINSVSDQRLFTSITLWSGRNGDAVVD